MNNPIAFGNGVNGVYISQDDFGLISRSNTEGDIAIEKFSDIICQSHNL